jgi:hypothetical protein
MSADHDRLSLARLRVGRGTVAPQRRDLFLGELDPHRVQAISGVSADPEQSATTDSDIAAVLGDFANRSVGAESECDSIADAQAST